MLKQRLFTLIVVLAVLTVSVLSIQADIAKSATLNVRVPLADYLRDRSGYAAPYVSRSDTLRDASNAANDEFVSRSDTIRSGAIAEPYLSRSDTLRSGTIIAPYVSRSDTLRGGADAADNAPDVHFIGTFEEPYPPGFELPLAR